MQSAKNDVQEFLAKLAENTRTLVESNRVGTSIKLSTLQQAIDENAARLDRLREAARKAESPDDAEHIDRLIDVRERASAFLVATSRWLVYRERHPEVLTRPPAMSVPAWRLRCEPPSSDTA